MNTLIYPVIVFALIALFFMAMPELDKRDELFCKHRLTRTDLLIMALITLVFGFVDFWNLGNTKSPESFADFSRNTAEIQFDFPVSPKRILLFSGVGTGEYTIEFSADGTDYAEGVSFHQDYAETLKWHSVDVSADTDPIRYARIRADGTPYLGELAFLSEDGFAIPFSSDLPELNDEQDKLCTDDDFMNSSYFDEIYHARTAWEHLHGIWPYEISHPPLGKIIIGIGISLFGMTPFGWRFSGVLFGVLMLPVIYIFIRKLFGSTRSAACGTILLATDFMHYSHTRIATIDTYVVFFILLMYLFMYLFLLEGERKYLALSGVAFGLGCASKWTGIYAGAGLAVIWLAYHIRHREVFLRNTGFSIIWFVLVPCVIYYLSYIPYGIALGITPVFSKEYLQKVIENQQFMFTYHSGLVAEHPYSSQWYQWILDIRPILYYLKYYDDGTKSVFGTFSNPVLCWGGLVAMICLIYTAVFRRDRQAAFILVGYLAQLVPWMFVKRLTFEYHYFPASIFLVLAMAYIFSTMEKKKWMVYGFTALSVLLFIWFYPVLSGVPVSTSARIYGWLPTWPF